MTGRAPAAMMALVAGIAAYSVWVVAQHGIPHDAADAIKRSCAAAMLYLALAWPTALLVDAAQRRWGHREEENRGATNAGRTDRDRSGPQA